MSSEDFFGRPISRNTDDIEFDLCEICQRRSPNWLQIQYQEGLPVVRFACNECHQQYSEENIISNEDVAREIKEDEVVEEIVRPGWVDEFIKEGGTTIQTIDTKPAEDEVEKGDDKEEEDNQKKIPLNPSDGKIEFSEAPDTFSSIQVSEEDEEFEQRQIAPWTSKFIHEALFGPNPEGWLDGNGGYAKDQLSITITTLGSFAGHDVTSVKLSAIQCLLGAYNREKSKKEEVVKELERYLRDNENTVVEFARSTISQLQ